ncbi:hypothetical protein GCM10028868_17560 [Virgibacillus kimchii]
MNMMGLVMAPMIILLAMTSFDRAVKFLGTSSWKWIHSTLVQVIFYIAMLRGMLYLFYFFQATPPDWRFYPPIWFLYIFLGMGVVVVLLQAAAFAKIVLRRRSHKQKNSLFQVAAVIGVAVMFAMPMALMMGTVAYFDSGLIKEPPAFSGQTESPENYAQNFEMVIQAEDQDIYIWVRDLDSEPYFRQTVEIEGEPISHQIYRYSEQMLYIGEPDADMELVWSEIENVGPEEIGILEVAIEPGVWAEQYGTGEHQIQVPEGELQITIQSVGEFIADEVFEVPNDGEPVSIAL